MKILTKKQEGSVLCTLPNGDMVEVTMLVAEGEDFFVKTDVNEAVNLLAIHVKLLNSSLN